MTKARFDHYYRYDELTAQLKAYAAEHPDFITLESIGKSFEGRDIWVVSLTNRKTGEADTKPALWLDGNIHSVEVTASSACLYHIEQMLARYGKDDAATHCLDTRSFYICPRINPDGAEWALADNPKFVRSSVRPYPHTDEHTDGVVAEDIDDDGRVLFMRVRDPNGQWKPHPDEPRLLIRRDHDDFGGEYYRLYREGAVLNYDGATLKTNPPAQGLDLNRNFPANWGPEGEQFGAGLAPLHEPETRAIGDFILGHPNIVTAIAGHTFSGVLLRPGSNVPDGKLPVPDLRAYKLAGEKGQALTGYPAISIYHDFRYHPTEDIKGTFDWVYDHLGIFFWTIEYWAPHRAAGLEVAKYTDWLFDHSAADSLKVFQFFDNLVPGEGHVDWYTFDHPQLGEVELGGWNSLHTITNPPVQLLEKELEPFPGWFVSMALMSPLLSMHSTKVERVGDSRYLVRLVAENTGYLPTSGSEVGRTSKVAREVVAEIELPKNAKLLQGKPWEEVGHLPGRNNMLALPVFIGTGFDPSDGGADRFKHEWLVEAPAGTEVVVRARCARAGSVEAKLVLD